MNEQMIEIAEDLLLSDQETSDYCLDETARFWGLPKDKEHFWIEVFEICQMMNRKLRSM